jgi:hypothetical protein
MAVFAAAMYLMVSPATADAQAITIDNPGFEDPILGKDSDRKSGSQRF